MTSQPFDATLTHLETLGRIYRLQIGYAGADWLTATQLADAHSDRVHELLRRVGERNHVRKTRPMASLFLGDYVRRVMSPVLAAYLTESRVPDVHPSNVVLRFDADGRCRGVALRQARFAALEQDESAQRAGAVLYTDMDALREWMQRRIEQHLAALIPVIREHSSLGYLAQWALAGDVLAGILLGLGRSLNERERAAEHATALLTAERSPLHRQKVYFWFEHESLREVFVKRAACCWRYKLDRGERCATCPLRSPASRDAALRAHLTRK